MGLSEAEVEVEATVTEAQSIRPREEEVVAAKHCLFKAVVVRLEDFQVDAACDFDISATLGLAATEVVDVYF